MWLAVFDGLFFLLLALDTVIVFLWTTTTAFFAFLPPHTTYGDLGHWLLWLFLTFGSVLGADWLIIRRVWRAINELSASQKPTNQPMNSNLKKNVAIAIIALTVIACLAAAWFYFSKPAIKGPRLPGLVAQCRATVAEKMPLAG